MTLEELEVACDNAENGLLKTGMFSVIVPKKNRGETMRIAPGLSGRVLSTLPEGKTLVMLESAKVREYVKKARLQQATPPSDERSYT